MNMLREFETNLDYYFSEILEKPFAKPCWIFLSLSHKCTYNCQMCGVVKILKGYELRLEDVKKVFETENSKFMEKHNLDAGLNFENLKGNLYKMIKNLKKQLINNN